MDGVDCAHHWMVSSPRGYRYSRGGIKGDLIEETDQVCQKCGEERLNTCVVPTDSVSRDPEVARILTMGRQMQYR